MVGQAIHQTVHLLIQSVSCLPALLTVKPTLAVFNANDSSTIAAGLVVAAFTPITHHNTAGVNTLLLATTTSCRHQGFVTHTAVHPACAVKWQWSVAIVRPLCVIIRPSLAINDTK